MRDHTSVRRHVVLLALLTSSGCDINPAEAERHGVELQAPARASFASFEGEGQHSYLTSPSEVIRGFARAPRPTQAEDAVCQRTPREQPAQTPMCAAEMAPVCAPTTR